MIETKEKARQVADEALSAAGEVAQAMLQKVRPAKKGGLHRGGYGFGWVEIRPARGQLVGELKRRKIGYSSKGRGYVVNSRDIDGLPAKFDRDQLSDAWMLVRAVAEKFAEVLGKYGVDARACNRGD